MKAMFRKTISLRNFLQWDFMLGSSLLPFCTSLVLNWSRSPEPSPYCQFCDRGRPRRRKQPHRPGHVSGWCEGRGNLPVTSYLYQNVVPALHPRRASDGSKQRRWSWSNSVLACALGEFRAKSFAFLGQLGWRTGPGRGKGPWPAAEPGSGGPRHTRTGRAGDGL